MANPKIRRLITQALYSIERGDRDNARAVLHAVLDEMTAPLPDENVADDDRLPALLDVQGD